jgi:cyclohexyl-isocyanide hydratase
VSKPRPAGAAPKFTIGILIFGQMTQLDATGPFEVFARIPGATVLLVAKTREPVTAQFGLTLRPHLDLAHCPKLDVLCVPGGAGVNALLGDDAVLNFIRRQAKTARFVTSVCTGSLVLGAAGLLRGRRAACHWLSLPLLAAFGAKPSKRRIVRQGRLVTAGGITSGIDFGLEIAGLVAGRPAARKIQLMLQYDPQPPFRAGTPLQAGRAVTDAVIRETRNFQMERAARVVLAAARLRG